MYSVVLATVMGLGPTAADCCWNRNAHSGYAASNAVIAEMPMAYGYAQSPSCGCGAPMMAPPTLLGDAGMALPPVPGNILPPMPYGDGAPPPPALNETRTTENQAQFVVRLPADAVLVVEGTIIAGNGPVRVFVSPPLEPGRNYIYELAIEVNRNGKTLRDSQTRTFQAGKTANVTFPEPRPDTTAPPLAAPLKSTTTTRIHVRVPQGANLYVEGRPWTSPVVQTPPLDPTQTHYYQMRVEMVRNGRKAVAFREVAFRAGQDLTVDFTSERLIPANVAINLQ